MGFYTSAGDGSAEVSITVTAAALGLSPEGFAGRTLVVHNEGGDRVACGVFGVTVEQIASLASYPGLDSVSTVAGDLLVQADSSQLVITGSLTGLEASVTGGLHIHSGTTCSDASAVGGHWWDSSVADPWSTATTFYTSAGDGSAEVSITVTAAALGLSPEGFAGRTLVVHNEGGDRVACGVFGVTVEQIASLASYPGLDSVSTVA